MAGHTHKGREANHSAGGHNDLDGLLMVCIFTLFGYILFVIISQYLAWLARYVYAPFVTPIWAMGENFGTIGSTGVMVFYSLIALSVWAVIKFSLKKRGSLALGYAIGWFVFAILEIVIGHKDSFMTANMEIYCNPENSGFLAIFSCQNTPAQIAAFGTVQIIIASILPNIILAIPSITDLFKGMSNLSDHPKVKGKVSFSMDGFIKNQKQLYPHLKLYDVINPNEVDGQSGSLRLMDNSRRLAYEHDLIKGFARRPNDSSSSYGKLYNTPVGLNNSEKLPDVDMEELVPVLDEVKFETLMLSQLGKVYSGVESLNAGQIIVLATVLPRACSSDENMNKAQAEAINEKHYEMMDYVWDWVSRDVRKAHVHDIGLNGFDRLDEYRAVIKEWINHDIAKKILYEHAYINTFIYRVMMTAKTIGVCQPSNFRYLKLYDRKLWALIQNVDRPAGFAENIAVVSHFLMEVKERRGINQPMLQAAYNGMLTNLQKYRYPLNKIEAWNEFKLTGDKTLMRELKMISKEEDEIYE